MSRPEGIRIEAEVIERCGRAAAVGANWGTIGDIAGVARNTLWRWRRQGEADIDAGIESDPAKFVRAIREGKGRDAMASLAILAKAASKGDVRVAMWKLERTHGYGIEPEKAPEEGTTNPAATLTPEEQLAAARSLPPDVLARALAEAKGEVDVDPDR